MNGLNILFILLFLFSMACLVAGARDKRRNAGFIATTAIISACDLICIALMGVQKAKDASAVLLPYYILRAWMLFAILVMLILIDRNRHFAVSLIVSGAACVYQTYLVINQYMGARLFSFQKRMYFRKAWWVATDDSKNLGLFFSFRSYRILSYVNIAIIILVIIGCIICSHRIFRKRYYNLMVMMAVLLLGDVLMEIYALPVWIVTIIYNLISILCLYLTGAYARSRLREWSLDNFANDMSDGLVLYDRYNDLIHMNDMIRNTLGESLTEEFRDRDRLEEWLESNRDKKENEIILFKKGDEEFYFKVRVNELGDMTGIGTLYILHDTTDSIIRIRAVEKVNEELERTSRMKSDFLANMSHEIRTPMNAVLGMAEIAMREKDPAQITDYLMQIQSSGKGLLNIINDILDYSKIESGKMEIIEEDYDPFAELSDIANLLVTRIADKPVRLFLTVRGPMPCVMRGDRLRIRQILLNLAGNAIKFTAEGNVRVDITCDRTGEDEVRLLFHVKDTGIGIRKEDMDKLFVSFQQVDSRRNRAAEGTGLGLAISQKLVQAMGGEIGVESEYGKGSDFWFSLPQKVVDERDCLVVEDARGKNAFGFDCAPDVLETFRSETDKLHVKNLIIRSAGEYVPTGGKDYIFFEEGVYDDALSSLLEDNPDLTGIVLTDFGSQFAPDRPNLHVIHRPISTMAMVQVLNDRFDESVHQEDEKAFRIDFTAPDARILVVDDNEINLTIAGGLMAPLKVRLDTAGGGQEAIDKVKANDYDIVFMDHMMPGIDGADATRIIRTTLDPARQPVIIALSANAMEEARRLFSEVGMNDFVAKPIDVRILTEVIRKWLPEKKIHEKEEGEDDQEEETVKISLPGLDVEGAVRALGSAALYDKIAAEYYRSGEGKLGDIMDAYEKEEWTDYTIRVHALKSSSRQIGALALGDMAEALEAAGKAGNIDLIRSDTAPAMEVYRKLLDDMAPYYRVEEEEGDKPPMEEAVLLSLLEELDSACSELDMDAMESVSDTLKTYSYDEDMAKLIASLRKAVEDMDTDGCTGIIGEIRTALNAV